MPTILAPPHKCVKTLLRYTKPRLSLSLPQGVFTMSCVQQDIFDHGERKLLHPIFFTLEPLGSLAKKLVIPASGLTLTAKSPMENQDVLESIKSS